MATMDYKLLLEDFIDKLPEDSIVSDEYEEKRFEFRFKLTYLVYQTIESIEDMKKILKYYNSVITAAFHKCTSISRMSDIIWFRNERNEDGLKIMHRFKSFDYKHPDELFEPGIQDNQKWGQLFVDIECDGRFTEPAVSRLIDTLVMQTKFRQFLDFEHITAWHFRSDGHADVRESIYTVAWKEELNKKRHNTESYDVQWLQKYPKLLGVLIGLDKHPIEKVLRRSGLMMAVKRSICQVCGSGVVKINSYDEKIDVQKMHDNANQISLFVPGYWQNHCGSATCVIIHEGNEYINMPTDLKYDDVYLTVRDCHDALNKVIQQNSPFTTFVYDGDKEAGFVNIYDKTVIIKDREFMVAEKFVYTFQNFKTPAWADSELQRLFEKIKK